MNAVNLLEKQLSGINAITHDLVADLSDSEWVSRAAPGANLLGFIVWHTARQQDNAIQTLVRGVPEVIWDQRWKGRGGLTTPGTGAGFSPAEADQVAHTTRRSDALEYADAILAAHLTWLHQLAETDLDAIPDLPAHLASYPEYQRATFQAEIRDLIGMPVWRFLIGTSIGHIRGHLGEADSLKTILRARPA
jgi:hypothetical protein